MSTAIPTEVLQLRWFWGDRLLECRKCASDQSIRVGASKQCDVRWEDPQLGNAFELARPKGPGYLLSIPRGHDAELDEGDGQGFAPLDNPHFRQTEIPLVSGQRARVHFGPMRLELVLGAAQSMPSRSVGEWFETDFVDVFLFLSLALAIGVLTANAGRYLGSEQARNILSLSARGDESLEWPTFSEGRTVHLPNGLIAGAKSDPNQQTALQAPAPNNANAAKRSSVAEHEAVDPVRSLDKVAAARVKLGVDHTIRLKEGESKVLNTPCDVARIAVSGGVFDVKNAGPRRLLVSGVAAGQSDLIAYCDDGKRLDYTISVSAQ